MSRSHHAVGLNLPTLRCVGRLFWLAARDFLNDNGPSWAAAVAYYSLLSIFPLLLGGASIASYFVDPNWAVHQAARQLGELVPQGRPAIEQVVKESITAGRSGGLLFILPLLWTGSLVFGAITKALNTAYDVEERYSFLERLLVRLVMLLTVGVLFIVALLSPAFARLLYSALGFLPGGNDLMFTIIVRTVPAFFLLAAFFAGYRFLPTCRPDWRAALFGAVVATVLFVAAQPIFVGYVQTMARYSVVYGSLAGVVVFVFWTWIASMIGIFGGQLASHGQSVFIENKSIEQLEKQHLRPHP